MKKVYFGGSIRGGRIDANLYKRLIEYIQRTDIVLTEHIGSPELNLMEQGKRDVEIYDEDTAWLRESDVVIAECSCPSLGVGYELAYAEKLGKPCHIIGLRMQNSEDTFSNDKRQEASGRKTFEDIFRSTIYRWCQRPLSDSFEYK